MKSFDLSAISASAMVLVTAAFLLAGERPVAGLSRDDHAISVQRLDGGSMIPPKEKSAGRTGEAVPTAPAEVPPETAADQVGVVPAAVTANRDEARGFMVSRSGTPKVHVTFLTPTAFRIRVPGKDSKVIDLPDYMRVKSDADYPPVEVKVEADEADVTFTTSAAELHLAPREDLIAVSVRTSDKALVENWEIRTGRRQTVLDLRPDERIFGFGDKRAAIDQRGNKVEMLNRDAFASETNNSYKSIPFYMSSAGYGLFFHNFYPSLFDVGATKQDRLQLTATDGDMDFYVFIGAPKELLSQYTELTGRPAMLPRWAFGYHQGKASYGGRDAFRVAAEMRRRKLPIDVIYYDDWDDDATEKSFINSLWKRYQVRLTLGFGMPMFGSYHDNDDSELLDELASKNFVLLGANGRPAIGPDEHVDDDKSAVAYLDYFSPRAVDHVFDAKWTDAIENGTILGMVDFGEMDHVASPERKYWPSLGMSVAKTRNLFGLVYPMSLIDGVLKRKGGRITGMVRPGFAGTQRLGWSTTGDSVPTYRNFRAHTRGMLNLTLSGFSNVGQDIGGWDRKGPDVVYARWFAAGTFFPFMWSHGQGDHEPYSHGEAVEDVAREFLNLRYRMVPYLYSLHEAAHRTGMPVLRALALQESTDPQSYRIDDQFFIGDNMLVAPLYNDRGDRKVYLPKGLWYDFFGEAPKVTGGQEVAVKSMPLNRLPVYVRAGAVIPLGPEMQHTGEKPVDPLSVEVYSFGPLGASDERTNAFSLYEDDGVSTAYQNGKFQRTDLRFRQSGDRAAFEVEAQSGDGKYRSVAARAYRLNFHGFEGTVKSVLVDGKEIKRADTKESGRHATWSEDETTGVVSVSIPRTSKRNFAVDIKLNETANCAGGC